MVKTFSFIIGVSLLLAGCAPSANLTTYHNDEYGFSFEYPAELVVMNEGGWMADAPSKSPKFIVSFENKEKQLLLGVSKADVISDQKGFMIKTDFLQTTLEKCPEPFWANPEILIVRSVFGDGGWADHWYEFVLEDGRGLRIVTQTYDFWGPDSEEDAAKEKERNQLEQSILKTFRLDEGVKSIKFTCTKGYY